MPEENPTGISNSHPEDTPPTDRGVLELIEDGGQWESWRVPSDGFVPRPESFMLAPHGVFGWHEAGALIEPTSPAMIGEGYFRMGQWRLVGQTLVVTEDWARLDNGDERNIDPPFVRQLVLAACSPSQRDKLGIPVETACVTIDGKPFMKAGDASMAESELRYAFDPSSDDQ